MRSIQQQTLMPASSPGPSRTLYEVRDTLFGQNFRKQDVAKAIERALASSEADPELLWLRNIFTGKPVRSREGVLEVFRSLGQSDDAMALCYTAVLSDDLCSPDLRRSAERKFPLACVFLAIKARGAERLLFAIFFFCFLFLTKRKKKKIQAGSSGGGSGRARRVCMAGFVLRARHRHGGQHEACERELFEGVSA